MLDEGGVRRGRQRRLPFFAAHHLHDLPRAEVGERHLEGQELPQDYSEAIRVRRFRELLAGQDLGGHPSRAHDGCAAGDHGRHHHLREVEVAHLDGPVLVDAEVGRLEIAVHDGRGLHVQVVHPPRRARCQLQPADPVKRGRARVVGLSKHIEQAPFGAELRHDRGRGQAHTHEHDDVGVAQAHEDGGLALEGLCECCGGRGGGVVIHHQFLHRHLRASPRRQPHLSARSLP
mmetsp:Transcript_16622/g.28031  ORF Transcript_16622/g.28031 Transcript_16622/m.28031 type:complete len:232 (-) Transcript_16622:68-763(-)